ncbi:Aste57867_6517 [Aphanomyces stellatus]|uniref:Aste57867_6517 protein n=2 Tax=Aphanomyces stellatus TaxID=120398 RepID=A0A485KHU7_9STRA|nr:hypothetical protein As57867_006500 [Aphanomyces stellatus]VFT83500.1 Aste57867_6517 [Aphanomyces stellatus]
MENLIGRVTFRIAFMCEYSGRDDCDCDMESDRVAADKKLLVKLDSPLLQSALPVLKAMCMIFQVVGLLDRGCNYTKYFFDVEKMESATRAIEAIQDIKDATHTVATFTKTLESTVGKLAKNLEENKMDVDEADDTIRKTLEAYREDDVTYERLKDLLVHAGYAFSDRNVVGGFSRRVVKLDHEDTSVRGRVRWVCAHHKEAFKDDFTNWLVLQF